MTAGLLCTLMVVLGPAAIEAERLHKEAVGLYAAGGHYGQAIVLWERAYALEPSWRFAINLAKAHLALGASESRTDANAQCWRWTEDARAGQPHPDDATQQDFRHLDVCRRALLSQHGLLSVDLYAGADSGNIEVTLDGRPWAPPWHTVLGSGATHVEVRRQRDLLVDRRIEAAVGTHLRLPISLPPPPAPSAEHPMSLPYGGPGQQALPDVSAADVAAGGSSLVAWRWSSLGVGVALLATGAGLLGHAYTLQGHLERANDGFESGTIGEASYHEQYDADAALQRIVYPSGVTLLAVGAAGVAAAIILFSLDDHDEPLALPMVLAPDTPFGVAGRF